MTKHIILVGLMGCGKSTVARLLRRKLRVALYEVDALIERAAKKTIPEIFAQDGEPEFRRIERETVAGLVQRPPGIVSTGGGTFVDEKNQQVLRNSGWVVYLHGTPSELAKRIQSAASRPLLHGRDKVEVLQELYGARDAAYRQAHVTVATDHRNTEEVSEEIYRFIQSEQL